MSHICQKVLYRRAVLNNLIAEHKLRWNRSFVQHVVQYQGDLSKLQPVPRTNDLNEPEIMSGSRFIESKLKEQRNRIQASVVLCSAF